MARQKLTPTEPVATAEPAPSAPPERAQDTGWFAELTNVLFELTKAHERSLMVLIDLTLALGVSGAMLAMWAKAAGYNPAIAAGIALVVLGMLAIASAFGYHLWATIRDVARWRSARRRNGGNGIAATPASHKTAPWFLELGDTLYDRCRPARRTLSRVGLIIVVALAALYLGRYADIHYLEIGGAAVFCLGGLAWAVASGYLVAVLIRGVALWRSGRTGGL